MVLKYSWLLFIAAGLVSCATLNTNSGNVNAPVYVESSMQEYSDAGLWVSGPLNNQFVVIGVSARLTKPDAEIDAAKEDAARRVSMYHGIQGSVEMANTIGSGGFFDYSADSRLDLQYSKNIEQYLESLTFDPVKDVIRITGATIVRFRYNSVSPGINYVPEKISGRPSWVNGRNLPEFPGYTTVVGYAGKRTQFRDTVFASCESAAAKLIESASSSMGISETTGSNRSSLSSMYISSTGRLSNFQILGFWINPDNYSVTTLAIARVSK